MRLGLFGVAPLAFGGEAIASLYQLGMNNRGGAPPAFARALEVSQCRSRRLASRTVPRCSEGGRMGQTDPERSPPGALTGCLTARLQLTLSAVHHQFRAEHEGGVVGDEEERCPRKFLRFPNALYRHR